MSPIFNGSWLHQVIFDDDPGRWWWYYSFGGPKSEVREVDDGARRLVASCRLKLTRDSWVSNGAAHGRSCEGVRRGRSLVFTQVQLTSAQKDKWREAPDDPWGDNKISNLITISSRWLAVPPGVRRINAEKGRGGLGAFISAPPLVARIRREAIPSAPTDFFPTIPHFCFLPS